MAIFARYSMWVSTCRSRAHQLLSYGKKLLRGRPHYPLALIWLDLYLGQAGVAPAAAIALAFLVFTIPLLVSMLGGFVSLFGAMRLRAVRDAIEKPASS